MGREKDLSVFHVCRVCLRKRERERALSAEFRYFHSGNHIKNFMCTALLYYVNNIFGESYGHHYEL